jgi:hypothetical protein
MHVGVSACVYMRLCMCACGRGGVRVCACAHMRLCAFTGARGEVRQQM